MLEFPVFRAQIRCSVDTYIYTLEKPLFTLSQNCVSVPGQEFMPFQLRLSLLTQKQASRTFTEWLQNFVKIVRKNCATNSESTTFRRRLRFLNEETIIDYVANWFWEMFARRFLQFFRLHNSLGGYGGGYICMRLFAVKIGKTKTHCVLKL